MVVATMTQKSKKKKAEDDAMDVEDNPIDGPSTSHKNQENIDPNGDIDHISDDEEGGIRVGDIYIPPAPKPALTFDTNGPRLIITHIVNENFKSYAGVQALGPFHKVGNVTKKYKVINVLNKEGCNYLSRKSLFFIVCITQSVFLKPVYT